MHVQEAVILLGRLDRIKLSHISVELDCPINCSPTVLYPKGYVLDKDGNALFKIVKRTDYIDWLKQTHNLLRKNDAIRGNLKRFKRF